MSTTTREGNEVLLRLKVGPEALGFARFLEGAAEAFAAGHIQPTNPNHNGDVNKAADQIRTLADNITRHAS